MWKAVFAGTTALAIAGGSLVYAQQRDRGPDAARRWQPSQEDIAAFADARVAALKAGLRLTPEQEKNWAAYESARRDFAKFRIDRLNARRAQQPPADPVERLHRQAEALSGAGAMLKRLADAQEPLYKSLDENQKHRFQALARLLRPHPMRYAGQRGRGGEGWQGGPREGRGQGGQGEPGQRGRDGG
jgi:hypothetical protein